MGTPARRAAKLEPFGVDLSSHSPLTFSQKSSWLLPRVGGSYRSKPARPTPRFRNSTDQVTSDVPSGNSTPSPWMVTVLYLFCRENVSLSKSNVPG